MVGIIHHGSKRSFWTLQQVATMVVAATSKGGIACVKQPPLRRPQLKATSHYIVYKAQRSLHKDANKYLLDRKEERDGSGI